MKEWLIGKINPWKSEWFDLLYRSLGYKPITGTEHLPGSWFEFWTVDFRLPFLTVIKKQGQLYIESFSNTWKGNCCINVEENLPRHFVGYWGECSKAYSGHFSNRSEIKSTSCALSDINTATLYKQWTVPLIYGFQHATNVLKSSSLSGPPLLSANANILQIISQTLEIKSSFVEKRILW